MTIELTKLLKKYHAKALQSENIGVIMNPMRLQKSTVILSQKMTRRSGILCIRSGKEQMP